MFSRIVSFITAFLVLACTVAAVSAAVYDGYGRLPDSGGITLRGESDYADPSGGRISETQTEAVTEPTAPAIEEKEEYKPRLSAPDYDNACYYSDENVFYASDYGMPNCTCYAWGRAYELLGQKPELCLWDARYWYDYNRDTGAFDYGDTPEQGAVACWAYADGGSGHVAVVESVDGDTITFSNSAYSGDEFYVSTAPVDDPSNGMDNWIFQGYIYLV